MLTNSELAGLYGMFGLALFVGIEALDTYLTNLVDNKASLMRTKPRKSDEDEAKEVAVNRNGQIKE